MTLETQRVVVVGAGQAGIALCAKLRNLGHTGPITLIGVEPAPPYQRPPLSKAYALGEMDAERLYLRPEEFYEQHKIDLRVSTRVTEIDRAARSIETDNGDTIGYDSLVLATGAPPRRLPAAIGGDLDGVLCIRTLEDADRFAGYLGSAKNVLIVGGGYIGLEAAAVAAKKGLKVTLIEAAPRILGRVACAETADYIRHLHTSHGVDIREGTGLERLTGTDGKVSHATLGNGDVIEADFVVVGIGVTPETMLAETSGITLDNGIAVDELSRTSDPSISAIGDCASFPYRGDRIRLESVGNAIAQAEATAAAIMGNETPYVAKPWFWSDQYDVKLQIAGLGTGHDLIVERATDEKVKSFWYFRGDKLVAIDAMNAPRDYMMAKRWIENGQSPRPDDIRDPDAVLKSLAVTANGSSGSA
ncbi:NAD(P)/FAD-dependent oxidoreductase [Roseibium sp.]|uniref:NAD(P)/FAD-dependent oxidoreductase n=1 Tax=Roseibium sp. TaxID=1936156 RepID=UPI003A971C07